MSEIITLGAGCFWCIEAVFQNIIGVERITSGYTGGNIKNPTYREICSGLTGHAEVVQITFDNSVISLEEILEIFWVTHDPTTLNRQGADKGTQYRSAIFYETEAQAAIAKNSLASYAEPLYSDPIVTEITPLGVFYPAEAYHQNYYNLNPNNGYCKVVIDPKIKKAREKFAHKIKNV